MKFSYLGVIADILWHEIRNHAPFVELGDFVVMPNHIHGILILDKPDGGDDGRNDVETGHALSVTTNNRTKPISKYWEKNGFINYWILQICRYQTGQPIRIGKRLAIPFSRSHNPK